MNGKPSTLVYVGLALLLGSGAAYIAQRWAENRLVDVRQHASDGGAQVVVAAREIEFGKRIEPNHLKLAPWPATAVPIGAFSNLADVVGKLSKYDILPGEPVLAPRVADPASGSLLASMIGPNKRAVAVRVDDVVGVGGFLLPGSHVDVVASRRIEQDRFQTRTILQNLKVLAVDQTASTQASDQDKPVVVRAVTLETNLDEAEILVQATREGTVQLALRNPEDHAESRPMADAASFQKPLSRTVAKTPSVAGSPAKPFTVIRGTQTDNDRGKP